ncbi:hypothetical protein, conserved [Trypanosoma brucei gambiense DAL972]|uniref:PH-like domain-containing protein n=1 Tax=Trypanosoma brucei gambiense (strain MHOM/CI/86/DAL972) TaxID=679716 RepID=C9ZKC9_TRYB9|nr:hypothetical protein, conserved [Trypanosoma brucei gambiense DAL972]CBH09893.1 hypothetical protein, conserved [Trypanosoma brucei gambiense DAL972]|eukprot:XP_011772186.1 hypothetical protein, conserved [Trypanosoma brucei gambiense DAL972]
MKSRQPTKNCINMHDIVAQPLDAVVGAINATLRRPEELDDAEVRSIFEETSFILLRAEEAVMASEEAAFRALFTLLNKGFAHSAESFGKGVEVFSSQVMLLEVLESIFHRAVKLQVFPLQGEAVAALLYTVGNLCDGDGTKDSCGRLFIGGLANILVHMYSQDVEEAHQHFVTQRAAVGAMIKLMKRSPRNRKLITSWDFLANCCALSVDPFFQLQCIELLYRVSRSNKSIFKQMKSRLSTEAIEKLASLTNSTTLISDMMGVLAVINRDRESLLVFPLGACEVAGADLNGSMTCYFAPHYFVLISSDAVTESTIPYSSIRSAKFVEPSGVAIRVHEFPASLVAGLSRKTPKGDTLTLRVSREQLQRFKSSSIHSWITAAMKTREGAHQTPVGAPGAGNNERRSSGVTPVASDRPQDGSGRKRYREESVQSAGSGKPGTTSDLKNVGSSEGPTSGIMKHSTEAVKLMSEVFPQKVTSIMSESINKIQEAVDGARVTTDGYRSHVKSAVEGAIQLVEDSLMASHSKAAAAVEKLNHELQERKATDTAFHQRIACIEIAAQQALEESRESEVRSLDSIKKEFEQHAAKYAAALDDELIRLSSPVSTLFNIFNSEGNQSIC